MKKILFIFGTRPEAIKLAPLIRRFQEDRTHFRVKVCITAQHREMLDGPLKFFSIRPDRDLNLMKPDQSLDQLTSLLMNRLDNVLLQIKPDLIVVQGDTTTAFTGALAGYYHKIPVAHVEAGLRSGNKYAPFPEEINRLLISRLADFHFAPTPKAREHLTREGLKNNIWITGNTVIDALYLGLNIIDQQSPKKYLEYFRSVDFQKRIILVTGHRRESFGQPFREICLALKTIAQRFTDTEIVYPVHLNPNVLKPVHAILKNTRGVYLLPPLDYPYFIWLLRQSYLVLTDSGGIQEEAPALGKPVLVMREVTERTEGLKAGTAMLVGTDKDCIIQKVSQLLTNTASYRRMAQAINPYGDGKASDRIIEIIRKQLFDGS